MAIFGIYVRFLGWIEILRWDPQRLMMSSAPSPGKRKKSLQLLPLSWNMWRWGSVWQPPQKGWCLQIHQKKKKFQIRGPLDTQTVEYICFISESAGARFVFFGGMKSYPVFWGLCHKPLPYKTTSISWKVTTDFFRGSKMWRCRALRLRTVRIWGVFCWGVFCLEWWRISVISVMFENVMFLLLV